MKRMSRVDDLVSKFDRCKDQPGVIEFTADLQEFTEAELHELARRLAQIPGLLPPIRGGTQH